MRADGKWIDRLHRDTPIYVAARRVLKVRLKAVQRAVAAEPKPGDEVEHLHKLRVSTRRAAAALRLFGDWCGGKPHNRVRRQLRRIRRAAGEARRCDVQLMRLEKELADRGAGHQNRLEADTTAIERLIDAIRRERVEAADAVESGRRRYAPKGLRRARRKLLRSLCPHSGPAAHVSPFVPDKQPYTLVELAARELPALANELAGAPAAALRKIEQVHQLRITGKRLRYAIEIVAPCYGPELRETHYPHVEALQERLGELNDVHELMLRVAALRRADRRLPPEQRPDRAVAAALKERETSLRSERDRLHARFLDWWQQRQTRRQFAELAEYLGWEGSPHAAAPARVLPPQLRNDGGAAALPEHRRFAAIDVGTNSIRMVVAETDMSTPLRVIDDLKETTRLGAGLYDTGRLGDASMAASLAALGRMKAVAQRYRVEQMRAIGTSALREAQNARKFIAQARQEAGVDIEVIDADHEARLAFSSVANSFDLGEGGVVTMDLGGGSTELVFSSGGVIDAVCKLPLGAVRLTETFGRDAPEGSYRFGAMRRTINRVLNEDLGEAPFRPATLIGTGGTFTNLARISILKGDHRDGNGRFPFAVRGYQMSYREVSGLLDWLRDMPLDQRRQVAGLSSRRAEIIVAGVCIVERVMRRLRVDQVRVHDGGIRDGLLREMIDGAGLTPASPRSATPMLPVVRAFAVRCEYERPHSEHVARLALRIFDQLADQSSEAAAVWANAESRRLLEAGGVLHDVGMQIGFRRHHRHGQAMILHADLPGLSRRETEILAALARYHRKSGPRPSHRDLRRLSDDDQRLVMHLAGILRIADGLDRLHTQNVRDVAVGVGPKRVTIEVHADSDPSVNIYHALRKADVFKHAFRTRLRIAAPPEAGAASLKIRRTSA